ncbi:dTDP-D-glucose 4,6-dehydratase-like protein [Lophiostoma macrostomum CBS 122681]|uniref:dTDP-D-glucose 4,6-dehydratase-like protein n=1 Tax=Lophiostoma macrostomum CBS 122681 TaxID=1314788 RepID=A0A6A6T280_9PLEO|nr:dTDP-D-glucose 4,6-dehydratase-like protein [Lophiostoma macrostomum CBS 122681]
MSSIEYTPPDSPKWKSRSIALEHPTDSETLALTGTGKFPYRSDIRNILITGGAGFIGSWVTRHLTVQYPEYNVVCFDKLDRVSSPANISCLKQLENFTFVEGDITAVKEVSHVLSKHDVDCVMHFAASSHVQDSFEDATTFTRNNVVGTQVLLDCVRRHGRVTRFLHVSTDEVYGETNGELVDETRQFLPTNPYAASKAAAEMYVHAYAKSFKIPTITIRSNNVYGPCQYPEKIIPRFFSLLSQGKPLTIQGSGLNSRRYLYGADAADAFDLILHKGVIGEAYNVGSAFEITNLEVAVRMLQAFGHSPQSFQQRLCWTEDRPFNDYDYRVNGSKLQALGWKQQISFETGLAAAVEWYRKNISLWWPSESDAE